MDGPQDDDDYHNDSSGSGGGAQHDDFRSQSLAQTEDPTKPAEGEGEKHARQEQGSGALAGSDHDHDPAVATGDSNSDDEGDGDSISSARNQMQALLDDCITLNAMKAILKDQLAGRKRELARLTAALDAQKQQRRVF